MAEGAHVLQALKAKLGDGYPALQIVLVDDRSTDDTGAQAKALNDPRLTVARLDTLPDGWLGKVNALHRGLESARGEWILFSDADVHLAPGTLAKLIDWAEREGIDSIAAVPKITPGGPLITAALAAFSRFIVTFPRLWAVEDPKSKAAMGVGAFNLFRRSALEKSPGLEWLKMEIADDAALGIMLKRAGARQRVVIAQDAVSLEFYESYSAMARALEKNGAMAPVGVIILGLVFATVLELGYLAGFADQRLWLAGLLAWALGVITQLGVCRWLGCRCGRRSFPGSGLFRSPRRSAARVCLPGGAAA